MTKALAAATVSVENQILSFVDVNVYSRFDGNAAGMNRAREDKSRSG
jgi:hypothetical protein